VAALSHKNIRRIDIAMKDSVRVRGVESVGDLDCERQQRVHLQRTPPNPMLQGQPFQKLHGDEGFALLAADVVNGANVGVVQRGCSLGLEQKTGKRLGISGNLLGQEFEGDEAMQARVFRLVDHAHPAAPELLDDAVMRDGSPDHRSRILRV
jgi:hypothetical protein